MKTVLLIQMMIINSLMWTGCIGSRCKQMQWCQMGQRTKQTII